MDKRVNKIIELIENTVDEVSLETLQSYREKRLQEPLDQRTPKKTKGIQRAYTKAMYKINKDEKGTFGDNKGYGQGRYMGDSVEDDLQEGDRSEFSANNHMSSMSQSDKKFRLIHKKTGSTRGIYNSHAEAMKAHGSHPMKSQLTVEEVEESDGEIDEASIRDAEHALSQHAQRKIDHENKYGPMSPADLVSHEKSRKLLLTKKVAAQRAYNKRVNNESMVARVQGGRKMVSAEAALRHAREIAHKRSPGSKPTMSDIAAAHRKLSSGVKESDERHTNESFVVKDPSGKTVAVKYSEGEAKKHAEDLSKKTGQKHEVKFERAAVVKEDTEGKDSVTLEIPALIRALEWAREDAEDDVAIHKFVEKLINHEGTVDMEFFSEDIDEALVFNRSSYPDVDHMHGRRLSVADTNRERKFTVATNPKEGHKEHRVTVSASSANHAQNLAFDHFTKNGLEPRKHYDGLRIVEGVVPSADRKVDRNGRPYPAHRVQVGANESETLKVGDTVWAKDQKLSYKTHSGKILSIGKETVSIKLKSGATQTFPKKAVSSDFETLNPNPYKRADESIDESHLPQEAVGKSNKKIAENTC